MFSLSDLDEAVSLHGRVLTFRIHHYGRVHPFTQDLVGILADTYRMAGRDHEATALKTHHRV